MSGVELRKLRNREVDAITPPKKNGKKTVVKGPAGKTTGNKSTSSTGRLSTSTPPIVQPTTSTSRPNPAAVTLKLSESIQLLESRVAALESLVEKLSTENTVLRQSVSSLQVEVSLCKSQLEQQQVSSTAAGNNISLDQEQFNTNIVIRGVDVKEDTPESDLLAVYEGIRKHLDIADVTEFTPESITVLPSASSKNSANSRPIRVQFQSKSTKVKFLQVRRVKKDIYSPDIGISKSSRRPILISEQLIRVNQELHRENTKVIRILDTAHVNRIRAELKLEPLSENGRYITDPTVRNASHNP